jgi:hypothetical protein
MMKNVVRVLAVSLIVCLSISCATTSGQHADARPRFHEAAEASVVLQFNSWDYIFVTQPDYRQGGFRPQLKREDLAPAFSKLGVRRDLAVVVVGWTYDDTQMAQLVGEWKAVLSTCGFQRVVCVRANGGSDLNGSIVVDDSQLPVGQQTTTAKL